MTMEQNIPIPISTLLLMDQRINTLCTSDAYWNLFQVMTTWHTTMITTYDSDNNVLNLAIVPMGRPGPNIPLILPIIQDCLLYTSDAADE